MNQARGSALTLAERVLGAAMLIGAGLAVITPAQAAFVLSLQQAAGSVVATGSGTIDLTGLSFAASGAGTAALMHPGFAEIFTGPARVVRVDQYDGVTGPPLFGSGAVSFASSGSGDIVSIFGLDHELDVPAGYISGSALSDISTYRNETFDTLGVTPGTYQWSWGSGASADSFTLDIPFPAAAEPSAILLLGLPLGLVLSLAVERAGRTSSPFAASASPGSRRRARGTAAQAKWKAPWKR